MRGLIMKLADKTDSYMEFIDRWTRRLAWAAIILALIYIILPALWTISAPAPKLEASHGRIVSDDAGPELRKAMREREDFIRFLKTTGSGGDMLILTGKTLPVDNVEHREFVYLDLIMDKTGKLAMLALEWLKEAKDD